MSARLALVSAPVSVEDRYGEFAAAASTQPSYGLVCLAAVAEQAGAEVLLLDASAANLSVPEALDRLLAFEPDLVGLSATTLGIVACGQLAARLKEARPQTLTFVGGCHVTALPAETLREFPAFDFGCLGEGEGTLRAVLAAMARGERPGPDMAGTVARVDGDVRVNERRPPIGDLDALPLPAWHLLPGFPHAYRPSPARIKRLPCASLVLTRGCPNKCVFCDRSVFGNACRAHSPERAVEILRDLRHNHGVREILLEDDTFVLSRRRVTEFCERLIAERLDVTWSCLARADRVTPHLLRLMRRAGCWHISYGIESGDPEILRAMRKNISLDQMEQAVRWTAEAGIRTKGFFMVGFPGETQTTLDATRELAKRLRLDDISVMQLTPFPGSELYDMAAEAGEFDRDWRRMNALNTVFVPHGLTREQLERARARMLREFYFRPRILWRKALQVAARPRLLWSMLGGLRALLRVTRRR